MTIATEEADLLERIRRDEPGAFEALVDRYGGRLLGFGVRMCGEREDAKDILQDTLLQAYRSLKQLEHPQALRSWLFRIAANACLMKRRKSAGADEREVPLQELGPREGESIEIPDPTALPDEELTRSELGALVRQAIAELPSPYRLVLVLRDIEQLSTEETSRAVGITEGNVKIRLHRARLMVRQRLARRLTDSPPQKAVR